MDLDALYEDWCTRDETIRHILRISAQTVAPVGTMQEVAFKAGATEGAAAERVRIRRELLEWLAAEQRRVSRVDEWGTAYRDFIDATGRALDRIAPEEG